LNPEVKTALYRIAQEALNNVAKHSGASQSSVNLVCQTDSVKMVINDNGKGFEMQDVKGQSLGLGIMTERAKEIDAKVTLESVPGVGTTITVWWANSSNPEKIVDAANIRPA
jgi:signal transduction histidine kinase